MLGLIQLVPAAAPPEQLSRLWLLFFGECDSANWWARLFRPGFRHIRAAAWFDGAQRWVYFDPCGMGTDIQVLTDAEFGPRFSRLVATSAAILRVRSRFGRRNAPAACFCVGQIKALLGIRVCALGPYSIYRHLLREGAEIVEAPRATAEADLGIPVTRYAGDAGRGP